MEIFKRRGYVGFEKIDAGGQANVYRTERGGKLYAIKVVRTDSKNDNKPDDDLKRELTIVRNLKHPNCIHVEELFRTKSKIYIIMDYMPNGTIGGHVRESGPLCEWNAKMWFCPVARALKYLHAHKIAHRDLKLDNVLLDARFNPILTDFGFSRFVPKVDESPKRFMSDTYCGTTSYNPPEILSHVPYEPFSGDIWCLGVMLFIMLNEKYPFDRHNKDQMYRNQMSRAYRLQSSIEVTPQAKELIHLLLEPVPEKRPTIVDVCRHGWFPIVFMAHELQQHQVATRDSAAVSPQAKPKVQPN